MALLKTTYTTNCGRCQESKPTTSEPQYRSINGMMAMVCKDCAAFIDKLTKKARDKQDKEDEEAAKRMKEKLAAEEAAKPKPADVNNVLAVLTQAVTALVSQNQQILEHLKPKENEQKTTTRKTRAGR
jgi:hypothetical protein